MTTVARGGCCGWAWPPSKIRPPVDVDTDRHRPHVDPPVTPERLATTNADTPARTRHSSEWPARGPHLFRRSKRRSTNNTAIATAAAGSGRCLAVAIS
ncbi:MAG: hypothetical protein M3143_04930, partial [Actinomycetota bacterium]|nr:hypothetical protein [Actinomycetota bacterium]